MAVVVRVTAKGLSEALKKDARATKDKVRRAILSAALRAEAELKGLKEPRNTGTFAAAWQTHRKSLDEVHVTNSAPYAGILEEGARPHAVSEEGRAAIATWALRKGLADTPEEAAGIAEAIAHKLRLHGQQPLWIVKKRLRMFAGWVRDELEAFLAKG